LSWEGTLTAIGLANRKSGAIKKPIPTCKTDSEAEEFVAKADLAHYDLSGGQIVRFEMRPKDKAVSLRLPEKLLDAVRGAAKHQGVPYLRFIPMAIESALERGRGNSCRSSTINPFPRPRAFISSPCVR
jgi:predicted DNA binding CopG/RHH family protein